MTTTRTENSLLAQKQSIISSIISYINAATESSIDKGDEDIRHRIGDIVNDIALNLRTDDGSWPFVSDKFLYDVYIEYRREEGTLTDYDLYRPGLKEAQFSSHVEYLKHARRVSNHVSAFGEVGSKTCTKCGKEKPRTSFRKNGGAVCNSCYCRKYRERKGSKWAKSEEVTKNEGQ